MEIIYNKIYKFSIDASFADLTKKQINNLFKDGRFSSPFLQAFIEKKFKLNFVDMKGYDFIDENKVKYELKSFTKNGADLKPSNMKGVGRKVDMQKFTDLARQLTYIVSDVSNFPEVKIKFISGQEVLKQYPNGKINKNDKKFFEE